MMFDKTEVWGFRHAIRGMRNPMDSHSKSDSYYIDHASSIAGDINTRWDVFYIGENDMRLAQSLLLSGSEHSKFMRMIHVGVDTDMPRYWWSEADTYHFNTKNSYSTMHKLLNNNNPITLDMFTICEEDIDWWENTIDKLENIRMKYKSIQSTTKDLKEMTRLLIRAKRMLPEGFLQTRTWDTNYAELRSMYFQRRNHRLKEEWVDVFCKWIESLPYAKELITYEAQK